MDKKYMSILVGLILLVSTISFVSAATINQSDDWLTTLFNNIKGFFGGVGLFTTGQYPTYCTFTSTTTDYFGNGASKSYSIPDYNKWEFTAYTHDFLNGYQCTSSTSVSLKSSQIKWGPTGASPSLATVAYSSVSNECYKVVVNKYFCPECSPVNSNQCDGKYWETCTSGGYWNSGTKIVGKCGVTCLTASTCGADGYIDSKTCSGNGPGSTTVQTYRTFSCSSNTCGQSDSVRTIDTCQFGCSNGACVTGQCTIASQCGTDGYIGSATCSGGNVVQDWKTWTCQANYQCTSSITQKAIQNCSYGCSSGACISGCVNGNTSIDSYGSTYLCQNNKWVQIYTDPLQLGPNQLIAMESFSGGTTISKTSTRYPVVVWARSVLPVIVIDASNNSVSTNTAIYNTLDTGAVMQIPSDQVWALFYVINNNNNLPTICQAVDVSTGQCSHINPGITIACSQGQFDPSLGLCVIQTDSTAICPGGGRYDVSLGVCIWNPPLQAVCTNGSVYNVNTQKCEYTPANVNVCLSGYIYNSATGKCEKYPYSQINCPPDYAYEVATDKCVKYPVTANVCPIGSIYNSATNKCEYTPASVYVCNAGFTYNSATGKCELRPANSIVCGIGTYDEATDRCVYTPQVNIVPCSKGVLTDIGNGNQACIYTPETVELCPTGTTYNQVTDKCEYYPEEVNLCDFGFTYNSATGKCEGYAQPQCLQGTFDPVRNACVYTPNLEYLCIVGTLSPDEKSCQIIPETSIICAAGWTYDAEIDKCTRYPDYWTTGENPYDVRSIWDNYKILIIIGGIIVLLLMMSGGKRR